MKKLVAILTAAVMLVCLMTCAATCGAQTGNLISNGDFENGSLSPWKPWTGQWAGVWGSAHSGDYCAAVASQGFFTSVSNLEPNTQYIVSAWVLPTLNNKTFKIQVSNNKFPTGDAHWINISEFTLKNDRWNYIECAFTTPADVSEGAKVEICKAESIANNMYIDDVYFGEAVPAGVIVGDDVVMSSPLTTTLNYNAAIGNSQGGTAGVTYSDLTVSDFGLDGDYSDKGVTFADGVLTVPSNLSNEAYTINLKATVSGTVNGETVTYNAVKNITVNPYELYKNHLKNSTFESGDTEPWTNWGGTLSVTEDEALKGKKSLYISAGEVRQDVNVLPNTYYIMGSNFKPAESNSTRIGRSVHDYSVSSGAGYWLVDTLGAGDLQFYSADKWHSDEQIFKTTENTTKIQYRLNASDKTWGATKAFYIDNLFLSEFSVDNEINGLNDVNAGLKAKTYSYGAVVLNNAGGTKGVGTYTNTWSLKEAYDGVSIDNNGVLTVEPTAKSGMVTVVLTTTGTTSEDTGSQAYTLTAKKTVNISAFNRYENFLENGGFEEGTTAGWTPSSSVISVQSDIKNSGNYSVHVSQYGLNQDVFVEQNKIYVFSGYVRADNETLICTNIWDYNKGETGNWLLDKNKVYNNNWTEFRYLLKTEDSSDKVQIKLNGYKRDWTAGAPYSADDLYFAEFGVTGTISGDDSIMAGSSAKTYTADVKNTLGTTDYLNNITTTWSLKEAYDGISINSETGALTAEAGAQTGNVTVVLTVSAGVDGFDGDTVTSVTEKTVAVTNGVNASDGKLTVDFSELSKEGVYIVALYDSNKLVSAVVKTEKAFEVPYSGTAADTAKVFVWDSLAGLKPVIPSISVNLPQ